MQGHGCAYRLGGDEFALIAHGTGVAAAAAVERACAALAERGEGFDIDASCGTVEVPAEATDAIGALELADKRMYEQKDSRRAMPGGEVQAVLLRLLRDRAPALSEHGDAVAELAVAVGENLGLPPSAIVVLKRAAELHDVGKIAIPDAILYKPGPLDAEEWEFMQKHAILGERILSAANSLGPIGKIVRASHERYDGTGYPDGLGGSQIPLEARIILACDAFDAMTSARSYAAARTPAEAITELQAGSGTQFDPVVVDILLEVLSRTEPSLNDIARARARVPQFG